MKIRKYSKEHEWVSIEGSIATVGITNHAQESLGDIVYIELPKINKMIKVGETVGVIESVKAASDLYSPVSGEIIEINNILDETPELINSDPENNGWYMKVKINNNTDLSMLMDFSQYKETFQ